MIVGTSVKDRGQWSEAADAITLDEHARRRRRMAMVSDGGIAFLLDLPEMRPLSEGDGIVLDDGRVIEVKAKPERLLEIRCECAPDLLVLAWQLGSRHVGAEIHADRILIREDPAVAELLRSLGAGVECIEAAFDPQVGVDAVHSRAAGQPHT